MHERVYHSALVRGELRPGEVSRRYRGGADPAGGRKIFLSDAIVSLISTEGLDIKSVTHLGRTIPLRLRTAVEERDLECVVPGCSERRHLEIDHVHPVIEGGATCLDTLARLCHWDHYLKTYKGYRLSGGPGAWVWGGRRPPRTHSMTTPGPGGKVAAAISLPAALSLAIDEKREMLSGWSWLSPPSTWAQVERGSAAGMLRC